jgi:hypothetical protein
MVRSRARLAAMSTDKAKILATETNGYLERRLIEIGENRFMVNRSWYYEKQEFCAWEPLGSILDAKHHTICFEMGDKWGAIYSRRNASAEVEALPVGEERFKAFEDLWSQNANDSLEIIKLAFPEFPCEFSYKGCGRFEID